MGHIGRMWGLGLKPHRVDAETKAIETLSQVVDCIGRRWTWLGTNGGCYNL